MPKVTRQWPKTILAAISLLAMVHAAAAASAEIYGRVVSITDGDTLAVLESKRKPPIKVRLSEIDTPESHQPFGHRAKWILSELVFGKDVRVAVRDVDRYGRTVGRVHVGNVDVNAEMVRRGAAWVYRQYSRDPLLLNLEDEARRARRGLWALPESQRQPPWEWRAAKRAGRD